MRKAGLPVWKAGFSSFGSLSNHAAGCREDNRIDKEAGSLYHGPEKIRNHFGVDRMDGALKLACLILGAAVINLPLGYLRSAYERFTFGWFFYVHLSIPVIIYLRVKASFGWQIVPLTICGAIAGQLLGGRLHRMRNPHG